MKRLTNAIFSLMLAAAMSLSAADFLPLAPGNSWTYQDAMTGQTFTIQVAYNQFLLNGNVYHQLRGYTPTPKLVRVNEYGNIVFWDEEREADVMLTSFDIVPGGWFEAAGRECPELGQPQEHRVVHSGPAGAWNALEIKYLVFACADTGDISEQFAENIGMVQRVVNTIIGPRTFDLIEAHLGSQSITAGQSGNFTVSALPARESASWNVTMRINHTAPPPWKLHFATAQEFDVRLRDSDGKVVWTWSADKLFDQAAHEAPVGRWSAAVTVPQPAVPEGAPQLYTIEAFVTNAADEPRFAAAATVVVSVALIPAPLRAQ